MLNSERLAEWKRLAEEASPGPWCEDDVYGAIRHVVRNVEPEAYCSHCSWGGEGCPNNEGGDCRSFAKYDGPFIAAAREAVPELVAEVERCHNALRQLGFGPALDARDDFEWTQQQVEQTVASESDSLATFAKKVQTEERSSE